MLNLIKQLDAGTVRGLLAVIIPIIVLLASFFGVDEALFSSQLSALGEKLVTLVALLGAAYAYYSRVFKPNPPLTETALQKTEQMIAEGKLTVLHSPPPTPNGPSSRQAGFASSSMFVVLAILGSLTMMIVTTACVSTVTAYKEASSVGETAYVVAEHYYAVAKEATDLKNTGRLPDDVLTQLRDLNAAIEPLIIGGDDPVASPGLRQLSQAFEETKSASTEAQLQAAVDRVVRQLAQFTAAVKAARQRIAQ
jgi:hypothetical protein